MPREVIMPALGMAQDSGVIVTWLKSPGDTVAEGDALFEVETDKATMEVEAQAAGFLTRVTAAAGDDVPVGKVIALISDTADAPAPADGEADAAPAEEAAPAELPQGHDVIMPALGMAQDTGLLVGWLKPPGDVVAADDVLFEVETDKSTMEVPAGHDGYVAALLAEAGEEVPVGQAVAIISPEKPDAPVRRRADAKADAKANAKADAKPVAPETEPARPASAAQPRARPAPAPQPARAAGRILASPKARRLALEQGLDLERLVSAGHPQPFHVRDLEALRVMGREQPSPTVSPVARPLRLTAETGGDGLAAFMEWAAAAGDLDEHALLAGFAAASLRSDDAEIVVAVDAFGASRHYRDPDRPRLGASAAEAADGVPHLRLRDLRRARVTSVSMGAEDAPVVTITGTGPGLRLTLECAADQLSADRALALLTDLAGRIEEPLRHLL
ncbi:biotin/lipoyl-containing protein [Limimaricola pyoseonensis]|uniref:Pyruvate dehydrogenase E2 component (Dihydrolipoamide acetyltransferase) n=1 Tax=Limimaricola pyoseonensis TaxID=521013 RepID=A0A1G7B2F5_9RHOB|nr:biotin/lipoyl-containing protein [Limimaricola pyoseonensis]SDE21279.1 pyruvate dehydrogenase E2 component (dihydrolipoamide acetyltransferase) [Limimaricola pyoseonensis]